MRKTYRLSIILFCAAILIIAFFWLRSCMKDDHIELGADTAIDPTPTQIQSIKAIGEWEFLSVSVEELADTVRKGILSNDELARIYYGTMRLGIDMSDANESWISHDNDTIEDIPDEEDEDVYEEVEAFEDFDDDFDEDFEDEFDEDYEELARIDDEEIEGDDEDSANAPSRYEEEFGDVDGQIKFIPDGGMPLNEEVLLIEDDLDESDTSDYDDFTDDVDGDDFGEYDNEI